MIVYFQGFLPVRSQTSTKITAITSSMCINAPTPGKAKNPINQSITTITAIVNNVFITNSLPYIRSLTELNVRDWELTPTF
jgi:hypothetical protein